MSKTKTIAVVYPCDPMSPVIGGIESFVRGMISAAPDWVRYKVIGATTEPKLRPVGKWSSSSLNGKNFDYYPLYVIKDPGVRPRVPATLRYEWSALFKFPEINADIIESHRLEHLIFRRSDRPFNLFLHQDMSILRMGQVDVRWKFAPRLYEFLEKKLFSRRGNVFCVRQEAVERYKTKYPSFAKKFHFQSTWMDRDIYRNLDEAERLTIKAKVFSNLGLRSDILTAVFVGRLDHQKDPILLLRAVKKYAEQYGDIQLLMVGDGVLRNDCERLVNENEMEKYTRFLGKRSGAEVRDYLVSSDFFLMTSVYEGMPISVFESLASGTPVLSTSVGEVPRIVQENLNGAIFASRNEQNIADRINKFAQNENIVRKAVSDSVAQVTASNALAQVFDAYQTV